MTFGMTLRRLRQRRRLTLEQVARKVKSHKGYISGIENGRVNPPSMKFIRRLATLFKVSLRSITLSAWIAKAPKVIRREVADAFDLNRSW